MTAAGGSRIGGSQEAHIKAPAARIDGIAAAAVAVAAVVVAPVSGSSLWPLEQFNVV